MASPSDPSQQSPEDLSKQENPAGDNGTVSFTKFLPRLKQIKRARSQLMVCFLTFPLYVMAVTTLLGNGQDIGVLMMLYMALYAGFGINLSVRRCPRCHQQFFVKKYFLNPFPRSCAHCGLSCHHTV